MTSTAQGGSGMTRYRAFGLEIDSQLPLIELTAESMTSIPDLQIVVAATRAPPEPTSDRAEIALTSTGFQMTFPGVGVFLLHPYSGVIEVEPARGAESLLSLPLLGPVMALWLHLKGDLVLHASAVAWRGSAYAFLGDKGAGKSTIAAALLALGGQLVTDDLLRLRWSPSGEPLCALAYPQLKLTDASAALFKPAQAQALASPHPQFLKSRFRLSEPTSSGCVPLKMICVLSRSDALALELMASVDALRACLEQVFVRRYGSVVLTEALVAQQFRLAARLTQSTKVVTLLVPNDLQSLEARRAELLMLLEGGGA